MGHYKHGHVRQRTSARIKNLIATTLGEGKKVEVLIAIPLKELTWKGHPVDIAAGLEFGLIKALQPEWNMQGVVTATLPAFEQA